MKRFLWTMIAVAIGTFGVTREANAAFTLQIQGPGPYNQSVGGGPFNSITFNAGNPLPAGGITGISVDGSITSNYVVSGDSATITTSLTSVRNNTDSAITLVFTATNTTNFTEPAGIVDVTTSLTFNSGSGSITTTTKIDGSDVTSLGALTSNGADQFTSTNYSVSNPFSLMNVFTVTIAAHSAITGQASSEYKPFAFPPNVVPEPSTMIALATALPMLGLSLRRRKQAAIAPATA